MQTAYIGQTIHFQIRLDSNERTGASSPSVHTSSISPRLKRFSARHQIRTPQTKGPRNAISLSRFAQRIGQNPHPLAYNRGIGRKLKNHTLAASDAPAIAHATRCIGFGLRSAMPASYPYKLDQLYRKQIISPDIRGNASPPHPYSEPASASRCCTDTASRPAVSALPPASPEPAPPEDCRPHPP